MTAPDEPEKWDGKLGTWCTCDGWPGGEPHVHIGAFVDDGDDDVAY